MSRLQSPLNAKAEPKTEWTGDLLRRNDNFSFNVPVTRRQAATQSRE